MRFGESDIGKVESRRQKLNRKRIGNEARPREGQRKGERQSRSFCKGKPDIETGRDRMWCIPCVDYS